MLHDTVLLLVQAQMTRLTCLGELSSASQTRELVFHVTITEERRAQRFIEPNGYFYNAIHAHKSIDLAVTTPTLLLLLHITNSADPEACHYHCSA